MPTRPWKAMLILALAPAAAAAQHASAPRDCSSMAAEHAGMNHAAMGHAGMAADASACASSALPTSSGQAAYAAISEVVRLLEADSTTDWTRVNVEALRQHLIDMDEVTMHAAVVQREVPGGFEAEVTGRGRTMEAIRRMLSSHAHALAQDGRFDAATTPIAGGVRLTVRAHDATNARDVAMVRGLGVAGILTEGNHHARHHLALARGDAQAHAH